MSNRVRTLLIAIVMTVATVANADVVTQWNEQVITSGGPQIQRTLAMVHIAMFDAANRVSGQYEPYMQNHDLLPGSSVEAAAAAAAHGILVRLFPAQQAALAAALATSLANVPDGTAESNGVEVGDRVAQKIFDARRTDNILTPGPIYVPGAAPGDYQITTPGPPQPVNTNGPNWVPFALTSISQFRPGAPYALTSKQYAKDLAETYRLGGTVSAERTADQEQIARWHTEQAQFQFNRIARTEAARDGRSILEHARFFAHLNMALADATGSVFDAKYAYNFWRPVTAIRNADTDGNDETTADPLWSPFLTTPPHPEYPAAHGAVQAAGAEVLKSYFGSNYSFSTTTPNVPGATRSYKNIDAYADEGVLARILGGMHFRTSIDEGAKQGKKIGDWVLRYFGRVCDTKACATAWNGIGPVPPAVEAPIAVHAASGTVFIGTFGGGIFKSTDGGKTFAAANTGLDNLAISAMVMNVANKDHVVVSTGSGIYQTLDGGRNWTASNDPSSAVLFLSSDPLNPQTFYAGFMAAGVLKKSTDGGRTWINANSGIGAAPVWAVVPDPHNSGVVYAATGGAGAYKSTNGGASWTAMPTPPVVWYVALDPMDSRVIYLGMNGDGVYKSTDAGATFARVGSPEIGVVLSLVVDPTNSRHVYAGTISGGVELSRDGGATWKKTTIDRGIAISLSASERGDIYVGTAFDGVHASVRNDKERWTTRLLSTGKFKEIARQELQSISAQNIVGIFLDPRDSKHMLLATNDGGLLGTRNGGEKWEDMGAGFMSRASRRASWDPRINGRVYAGSFNGGGLFRSDDNGYTWTRHRVGTEGSYVWATGVDPFTGAVYAGTQNSQGLWRSTDGAATFTRIDGGLMPRMRDIVFDEKTQGKVFFAAIDGLFRSLDSGTTFTRLATGAFNTVTIDPTNPNVVYAASQTAGVLKSTDGGATFVPINNGLVTTFSTARGNGVAVDPTNPNIIYVGTEGAGLFKSFNGGAAWFAINDGITNMRITGLALDPARPNVLYASSAYGIFKTTTGGE